MDAQKDWQNDCPDIKSRGKIIFETEQWSDCRFLVGTEPNQEFFSGHKLILAMASPVFERMFYGNLPDKTDPILIPDVAPDAFRGMMEYIYTDKIKIDSFEKACELCYVAKKYILPHVVKQCTSYLFQDLNPTNVCRAYEFAKLFEEPSLKHRCLQIISRRTKEILADESFMEVELSTLLAIFSLDQLNIESELDLFKALNDYAIKHGYVSASKKNDDNSNQPGPSGVVPMEPHIDIEDIQDNLHTNMHDNDVEIIPSDDSAAGSVGVPTPSPGLISTVSTEAHSPAASFVNENNQANMITGEGPSKPSQEQQAYPAEVQEILPKRSVTDLKDAIRKIRFLTLSPQQFSEIPAKSELLSESEALAIFIIISNPMNSYPMPEGFCTSRVRRSLFNMRNEEPHAFRERDMDPFFSPPVQEGRPQCIMALHLFNNYEYEPEVMNPATETRKFYCIRTIRQQIDYRNTSVTDCAMTFHVDTNILITGFQVPTQVLMDSTGFTQKYAECLYAHLLDAQGSRLAYTHLTSRVRYESLLDISFDRPVFIHRNKMYKIGIVFSKVGWYPMYTCYPEVTCDNVHFMFNIGAPHESLRDGLIRAIVFTHPVSPSTPSIPSLNDMH
ncbi:uncharacterized protein LOC129618896 [Condylostylus longicornis]|uniref:uncharacterized protein LOC129618896 n=1 Tax=Condylostylus longicornis TaxID=2530218 RepID=UPI00244DD973|nr:uncharacterized protein LOC129618896 [Condylostylus longicornis]